MMVGMNHTPMQQTRVLGSTAYLYTQNTFAPDDVLRLFCKEILQKHIETPLMKGATCCYPNGTNAHCVMHEFSPPLWLSLLSLRKEEIKIHRLHFV